jgi:hypothetical protein
MNRRLVPHPARRTMLLAVLAAVAGCMPAAPPAGAPVADPEAAAAQIVRATTPASPRQTNFRWELNEAGSRLTGQGVARYIAPERIRLDLFGPRGETYLAAALVGDDYRVPPQVAERFALPSPALLWATIGVVRPPSGAVLQSVTATEMETVLRYLLPDQQTLEYRVSNGAGMPMVRRVDVLTRGRTVESLELTWTSTAAGAAVDQARYRDLAAYRELILRIERTTDVASFPEAVWSPSAP